MQGAPHIEEDYASRTPDGSPQDTVARYVGRILLHATCLYLTTVLLTALLGAILWPGYLEVLVIVQVPVWVLIIDGMPWGGSLAMEVATAICTYIAGLLVLAAIGTHRRSPKWLPLALYPPILILHIARILLWIAVSIAI